MTAQDMQRRNLLRWAGTGAVATAAGVVGLTGQAQAAPRASTDPRQTAREQANKAIVGRWFDGFWGPTYDPAIVEALAAPDMLLQYSLHVPRRGRTDIRAFMKDFRASFPDLAFAGTAPLIAQGDLVGGRWRGGGTHTGAAFSDFLLGSLPAATGRKMHFSGTTVLRLAGGRIVEEIGLDDGVTALTQLGLVAPIRA